MTLLVNDHLDSLLAALKADLPGLRACERAEGLYGVEDLSKRSLRTPALYAVITGFGSAVHRADESIVRRVRFAAAVLTKDSRELSGERAGVNIVEFLNLWLVGKSFHHWVITAADVLASSNLQNEKLRRQNLNLWQIEWQQSLVFGGKEPEAGALPIELYASRAPLIGADHEKDYQGVSNA